MPRMPLTLTLVAVATMSSAAQTPRSPAAATELVEALTSRNLDAVAAVDPRDPRRFVAAMYVRPSQLLVVGARHPSADALSAAIGEGRYRDVYLDLQTTPAADHKVFIHDMGADGLVRAGESIPDNAYRDGVRTELAKGGRMTKEFGPLDEEYSRMLRVLVEILAQPAPGTSVPVAAGLRAPR